MNTTTLRSLPRRWCLGRLYRPSHKSALRPISLIVPIQGVASPISSRSVVTAVSRRPLLVVPPSSNTIATIPTIQYRNFQSEGEYHRVADDTLETIQDVVEETLEDGGIEAEVSLASGVLTIALPDNHGTYVLNKQTPNQQIWWSSPISGPRRYEYKDDTWVFTRDDEITLHKSLQEELQQLLNVELDWEV
ncbi:Frataxin homolog, mitochondrial [Seminavis robusta]|uniref:ferroxidase n=1 Tax=Seminavis robusta TaxID=568900 RepID=A0A9N8HDB6_9STRA|nr:Frataxin homolog, mitochondrial [Seminavis robusta]|eukprot:Sro353_g124570.1 Frataxin homolog, mitochondrial (191) ;mRNA; f:48521-49093